MRSQWWVGGAREGQALGPVTVWWWRVGWRHQQQGDAEASGGLKVQGRATASATTTDAWAGRELCAGVGAPRGRRLCKEGPAGKRSSGGQLTAQVLVPFCCPPPGPARHRVLHGGGDAASGSCRARNPFMQSFSLDFCRPPPAPPQTLRALCGGWWLCCCCCMWPAHRATRLYSFH